jgi:hypothetical protein
MTHVYCWMLTLGSSLLRISLLWLIHALEFSLNFQVTLGYNYVLKNVEAASKFVNMSFPSCF